MGGCYILVDGGAVVDTFAVGELLGPVLWMLSKCFLGPAEGMNALAKTKVGPRSSWWLNVCLEPVDGGEVEGTEMLRRMRGSNQ